MPIAFARSTGSVNRFMIRANATAETTAPPTPCIARAPTSNPCEFESPQASEASVNSTIPARKSLRCPKRSPRRPPRRRKPPKVSMYAFITQTSEVCEKRRSAWIEGSATFTTVVSRTVIRSPRQRTMSASQRFRWSMLLVTIISPLSLLLLLPEVLLHLAKALDRLARSEILELEELPDLDLGFLAIAGGIGITPRPFHRLFPRLHLDNRVAGDQLLNLGEGPVDHGALGSRVLDSPALLARLEPGGIEQHPGFLQLLVVLLHLADELLGGHHARFRVFRRLDYHHESHGDFSVWLGSGKILALTVRRTRLGQIDTPKQLFFS